MTLRSSLVTTLEGATGARVLFVQHEPQDPIPCIVCTIITERQLISHTGDENYRKARVQITCMDDDYSGLETLVEAVRDSLNANTTDFEVSLPLETRLENKEDNIYYSILEYYISYRSI